MAQSRFWVLAFGALALSFVPQAGQTQTRPKAKAPALGAPIALAWNGNEPCNFGPALARYIDRANADKEAKRARANAQGDENIVGIARVDRLWGRVWVNAVSVGYETIFIHFDGPLPDLLKQSRTLGIRPLRTQSDGSVIIYDEGVSSALTLSSNARERSLGRSVWWCGS
jgi:hypothetical protein